jgi:hypothetical protein
MPTKRRPLRHAPRVGDVRVTPRMLTLWRAFQDEIRKPGRTIRRADLIQELHVVLRHLPWESGDEHELHYHQLHLLAYEDEKTRPERLDITGDRGQMAQSPDR